MWIRLALLNTIVAATALAACNLSKAGNLDRLKFTPADCGASLIGCNFAYSLAVGADMNVQIMSTDPLPPGLDLQSEKPTIYSVSSLGNLSGVPTWQLHGVAPGDADLNANATSDDGTGTTIVDMINIQVTTATQLGLVGSIDVPQPIPSPGSDTWTVVVNSQASFQVVPFAIPMQTMHLTQLTGRLSYELTPPPVGLGVLSTSTTDLRNGVLIVKPTAIGSYPLNFYHLVGNSNFNVKATLNVVSMSR